MEVLHHPVKEKIKRGVDIALTTLGWIFLGLSLGFGTIWGSLEYALVHASFSRWDRNIVIFKAFSIVILATGILVRIHHHRRNYTIGDYWRVMISLLLCMAAGVIAFFFTDGLVSIISSY